MNFFIPGVETTELPQRVAEMKRSKVRAAYRLDYVHGGSRFEVEVGKRRLEYRRRRGPRGGYIKGANFEVLGSETGGLVLAIVKVREDLIEVYTDVALGWAQPSLVGTTEVTSIEFFDEFLE